MTVCMYRDIHTTTLHYSTGYWLGVKILYRLGCNNVLHQPFLTWDFRGSVYFDGEKITTISFTNF